MAYFFKWQNLPKMLNAVFSTSAGHDHDGTNSKAVTVGTIANPPAFLLQLTYTIAPV